MKVKRAFGIIITVIVTLSLGVISQEIFNANGWLTLVALAQAALIVFVTSKFMDWHFKEEGKQHNCDANNTIEYIKSMIFEIKEDTCRLCKNGLQNENLGIIKSADLPELERQCSKEVWILAYDLHTENREDIKELVLENLKKGIKYKYFVSNTYNVCAEANDLITEFSVEISNRDDYEFYLIDDDYFFFIKGLDIVIYDPMELDSDCLSNNVGSLVKQGRKAYASILSQNDNTWYEVPLSDNLIDQIILMVQKHMSEITPIRKG